MKIMALTQQDSFFIPQNLEKAMQVAQLLEIVNVNCKSSLNNRPSDFIKWFGCVQAMKMAARYGLRRVQGAMDHLSGYRFYNGWCSLEHIARKHHISYRVIADTNSPEFFGHVKELSPDLIISYSAPQVIKEPLLSFPRHGIINVHGSLLPDHRGCMPSFWHLYNGEEFAGATVHYMSSKIDDGAILLQEKISIKDCDSMFDVMRRTKQLGGELIVKAIQRIESGTVELKPNVSTQGRYFSWPTKEQGRQFIRMGKRLV